MEDRKRKEERKDSFESKTHDTALASERRREQSAEKERETKRPPVLCSLSRELPTLPPACRDTRTRGVVCMPLALSAQEARLPRIQRQLAIYTEREKEIDMQSDRAADASQAWSLRRTTSLEVSDISFLKERD